MLALPATAQFTERIDVSVIELPAIVRDANGKLPPDLKPEDFTILEDGVEQRVIGVDYARSASALPTDGVLKPVLHEAPSSWQVVIYVQQSLSTVDGLRRTLSGLAEQAKAIAALGEVEIIVDYPTPRVALRATRDASAVRAKLEEMAKSVAGQHQVVRMRRDFLEDKTLASEGTLGPLSRAAARMEAMIIRQRQDALLEWLARYPRPAEGSRPRMMMLAGDGFDLDPLDFYGAANTSDEADMRALSAGPRQQEIARALAAAGWTAFSFAPGWMTTASAPEFDASSTGHGRLNSFLSNMPGPGSPTAMVLHPLDPLHALARETGGSVQTNASKLAGEIEALANRVVLTYQIRRRRDGQVHRVEIRPRRPGLTVRAQQWVVSGTPEAIASARAATIASAEGERGELPIQCVLRTSTAGKEQQSELEATVSLAPIDAIRPSLQKATLRFAVAVVSPDAPPFSLTKRMEGLDLAAQPNWKITFQVKHRPGARIAVVADEPATGAWGGCTCEAAGGAAAEVASAPLETPSGFLSLDAALAAAKKSGRIILLYLRSGSRGDRKTDDWFAHARSHEALKTLLADVVVAAEFAPRATLDDLVSYRQRRSPNLVILDPGGGLVDDIGFMEYGNLAAALAQLRRQAPVFAASARAREGGRVAEALLLRGNGLLYAGVGGTPKELFTKALAYARPRGDEVIAQDAEIGLATIASRDRDKNEAMNLLKKVAASPANPDLGSRAWILIGHELKEQGDKRGAVAAYQNGWRIAPKPSRLAEAARRYLEMMGSAPESDVQAAVAAGGVRLLYPRRPVLAGDVEVSAAAPPAAARVEFYLDDVRVAERTRAPFAAKVPLGAVPRVHTIKVVAFDANEARLGEDAATINDRSDALAVEIVAPRDPMVESKTVVEVRPYLPEGGRLEAIDLYWNETKLATLTAPPFRYEMTLPAKGAFGYIRAVARDATNATAEDTKLINSAGAAEEVRVDAVELQALVEERDGHNIEGLTSKDFAVREDGAPVAVDVRNDPNEAITVGIAVDASESMRNAMSSVMDYATEFLRRSLSPGDQTFVVSFAETPMLYQPLTSDLEHVSGSIFDMRAYGATALWDAVIFSLDQLRSVRGKRALLLFTDGADTGSRATAKAALQYAHEIGVPVYVVLIYTGSPVIYSVQSGYGTVQTEASVLRDASVRILSEETGGAFIRFPRQKDLPKLFQQVRDDTRGAYTLSFVSHSAKKRSEMRKISVAVPGRRGVVVRAPSAYYPR